VFPGPGAYVIVDVDAEETQTGRLMIGAGVNSNAGLSATSLSTNKTSNITRLPQSWDDIRNGTAFRGAGQGSGSSRAGHAVAAVYGTFQEPYLFDTRIGLSTSASYYTRYFYDWAEGRVVVAWGLGYSSSSPPTCR